MRHKGREKKNAIFDARMHALCSRKRELFTMCPRISIIPDWTCANFQTFSRSEKSIWYVVVVAFRRPCQRFSAFQSNKFDQERLWLTKKKIQNWPSEVYCKISLNFVRTTRTVKMCAIFAEYHDLGLDLTMMPKDHSSSSWWWILEISCKETRLVLNVIITALCILRPLLTPFR